MPHTYFFRQFLGHPISPELRRLFSTLELWRQRGYARPLLIIEQGDQNIRYYLEQYLRYRHSISNFSSLVIDGDLSPRPFINHPNHRRAKPTIHPDHYRGQTYPMIMLLDTQEYISYANPMTIKPNRFPRFFQALYPATSPMGFFIIHLRIDRSFPIERLANTNVRRMLHLICKLAPPDTRPPRPIHHPPDPTRPSSEDNCESCIVNRAFLIFHFADHCDSPFGDPTPLIMRRRRRKVRR